MRALMIGLPRPASDAWFDLGKVMQAVGDRSALRWRLRNAEFNGRIDPVWPDGVPVVQDRTMRPGGLPLSWQDMQHLAITCQQIIDGDFTGYDHADQPQLKLLAHDSTCWIVWSADPTDYEQVIAAFPHATETDEPPPLPIGA
ncbi:hypothetical protein [Pseudonocardia sp.]|jgi:hypothetical protein|uniref:hypothetical protein n=1 Tax=Pseudonocardia sp. TaxID=60912 RepID=UPI0031FDD44D